MFWVFEIRLLLFGGIYLGLTFYKKFHVVGIGSFAIPIVLKIIWLFKNVNVLRVHCKLKTLTISNRIVSSNLSLSIFICHIDSDSRIYYRRGFGRTNVVYLNLLKPIRYKESVLPPNLKWRLLNYAPKEEVKENLSQLLLKKK